jgi:hypothetical protein
MALETLNAVALVEPITLGEKLLVLLLPNRLLLIGLTDGLLAVVERHDPSTTEEVGDETLLV